MPWTWYNATLVFLLTTAACIAWAWQRGEVQRRIYQREADLAARTLRATRLKEQGHLDDAEK